MGVGRGNSGLPQQARTWSGSRPLCPVGRPSVREGAALRLPSPQPSHLVGWPHCSWEEQLWSGLSLVTGLPGVGPALSPRLWLEEAPGWGRIWSLSYSVSGALGLTRKEGLAEKFS